MRLVRDAFVRFRASDGFSHAAVAGVRDVAAAGAGRHRARGCRRRARRHRPERIDRARHHRGGAGTGGEGADQRGLPCVPHRRVRSVRRPRRHRGDLAHHRDDVDGPDRAGAEPPLRDRTGPPHGEEVRPGVRAGADRRCCSSTAAFAMFALGHGIGAGHRRRHRLRRSGTSSAGRSRSCSWCRRSRCSSGGRPVATSPRGRGWRSARRCRCCCGRWSRSVSGCSSSRARRSAGPTDHWPG